MTWDEFFEYQSKILDGYIKDLKELEEKIAGTKNINFSWRSRPGDQMETFTYILWGENIGRYLLFISRDETILAKEEKWKI